LAIPNPINIPPKSIVEPIVRIKSCSVSSLGIEITINIPKMINPPFINSNIGIALFGSFRPTPKPITDKATAPPPKIPPRTDSFKGKKPL